MSTQTIFQKTSFLSLFNIKHDGSLTPKSKISIVGVGGTFNENDSITELKLSDKSHIHDYLESDVKVRFLQNETVIMGFA